MTDISNSIVLPENLPEIEPQIFNKLDKKYLRIILIRILIFFLLLAGSFTAFVLLSEEKIPTTIIVSVYSLILFVILYLLVVSLLGFPKKGYLVREQDISFQKGLIFFKLTTVPFNRIQHVEVNQGILAKIFHLSSVKIYTAGGTASDLSIPGLPFADAHKLKAFLSKKISEHE
jgi:hypothetical protein